MKKILFVIPSLSGGGAERVLLLLLRYLNRIKFHPVVVTSDSKNDCKEDILGNIKIISLNKKSRSDSFRCILTLSKLIKNEAPALICSFLTYANYLSVLGRGFSGTKVPLIFTEHANLTLTMKQERLSFIKQILVRKLYPKADRIICVSKGVKEDLVENWGLLKGRCMVIHNSVEIDRVQQLAKDGLSHPWFYENVPLIVSCGRLTAQKNFPLLLNSVAIASKMADMRLIILGDGELKSTLVSYAIELGISDKVAFLGFQLNPFKFMARAKVFVLPSSWEGFGNVLIEAMACGTPVISTDCPSGPNEIITDGITGLLVPVGDETALAETILRLLKDEPLRKRLAEAGRRRAEDFRVDKMIAKYERVFEEVTAHGSE